MIILLLESLNNGITAHRGKYRIMTVFPKDIHEARFAAPNVSRARHEPKCFSDQKARDFKNVLRREGGPVQPAEKPKGPHEVLAEVEMRAQTLAFSSFGVGSGLCIETPPVQKNP
jgi:hypothetical protein